MMSSTISIFTRPSSGCSPASNPTTPIRMITTPTTPAYVLAMFFRPPCKDRSSTQVPAATAEKLADSLTFLPYLLSDGPLRRPEADLRVGAVAERFRRRTSTAAQRYGLPLSGEPVALGIDDNRILHQVRSVEGSNLRLFSHSHPCLHDGWITCAPCPRAHAGRRRDPEALCGRPGVEL